MSKSFVLVIVICAVSSAWAGGKSERWLEVRSPHFRVVTSANEKQASNVAQQFERMRAVFHDSLPNLDIDAFAPITILAVRNEKEFRALEPAAYLAKGSLRLGGLFLRVPEKNYILLRLDTEGEHPYAVVYHEYTHLLTSKGLEWMPLWLNEGLAEFYQNTEIETKDVLLGRPSVENLTLLRENRLLPLSVLFTVDHDSPYYHEENKGSIFYAESWALTHLLLLNDFKSQGHALRTYLELLAKNADPVEAAAQAFGDLQQLQTTLQRYVGQQAFQYVRRATSIDTTGLKYQIEPLAVSQADAVRADFLAYNQRTADARAVLQQVLRDDPNNVSARETMGFLEGREGHMQEARKWYEEAVKLDSQSYLANYNFAALAMTGSLDGQQAQAVESSLRTAIKLNPKFAPAYDRLAVFYGMRHTNLDEARMLSVHAVAYEPDVLAFRMNSANILLQMNRPGDAVRVLEAALKVAKNEHEKAAVQSMLTRVQQYEAMRQGELVHAGETDNDRPPALQRATGNHEQPAPAPGAPSQKRPVVPAGPQRSLEGKIRSVQCSVPAALELQLEAPARTVPLHSDNYFKIVFSALNFTPAGDLRPCSDLEGKNAIIEYIETGGPGQIVAVQLKK